MDMRKEATAKKSFILYNDFSDTLTHLSDKEAGIVFKAIYHYQNFGKLPDMDRTMKLVMQPIVSQFKRDEEKYSQTCEKRSAAGRKGGVAKQANARRAKQTKQKVANLADSESESDSVNDNENDINTPLPAEAVSIADSIISHVKELNPTAKNISDKKLKATRLAWASDVDKAARLDGRTFSELSAVFEWARTDEFWRTNVLSGGKLRKQYDQLYVKMMKGAANQPVNTEAL